ncbi:DNA binding protein [Gordonia phage Suzy]|uniref:DNA binding protein n=1 Tax=Gordonia phage Suzy TaxID=2201430 RepID=A0A2Z4Q9E6_9CAUD|nr:DNA binding protein [Gordonia phage Suzy]AWY06153.1 DNA binding protein [Gordonia phage Suzy]
MTKTRNVSKRNIAYTDGRSAWQEDEDRFLEENCKLATIPQMAKFLGRTVPSVTGRMKKLGLSGGPRGVNKDPFRMPSGAILIARTCLKCGLFLPENWFHVSHKIHRDQYCKSCRNGIGKSRDRKEYTRIGNEKEKAKNVVTSKMATRVGISWEEEEDSYLRENYKEKGDFQLAIEMGRTMKAITHRRHVLGLSKNRIRYTDPRNEMWVIHFPNAMKALREEFKKLGIPEEEWDWND